MTRDLLITILLCVLCSIVHHNARDTGAEFLMLGFMVSGSYYIGQALGGNDD